MNDTKMLQALLDGQTEIKKDLSQVKEEVKKNGKRIDKIGMQLAELADDAPTIEEFDNLKKRVTTVEHQVLKN